MPSTDAPPASEPGKTALRPIVDVHAHCFPRPDCFSEDFVRQASRARGSEANLVTDYRRYWDQAPPETRVIVFGGKAKRSGLWVDDADVAAQMAGDPQRLIGFLSLDLSQPGWREELAAGHQGLGLRGVKLMPMYAGFFPNDRAFDDFWDYVSRHRLPVILHAGTTFVSQAPLACTLPILIDDVAIRFPEARIWLAHLGHPYEGETVAVIRKHAHVYSDISALFYRPWQLFHSLMLVHEYRVWDKLLFGTDFPFTTVNETIDGLRSLGEVQIDRFRLPPEQIEALIHRDALALLGLDHA